MKKVIAIVPAAGKGKRLKRAIEKAFVKLHSKPILAHTLKVLNDSPYIDGIVLVVSQGSMGKARRLVCRYKINKVMRIVKGGKVRAISVLNGLKQTPDDTDLVMVHDGVRPFLDQDIIKRAIKTAERKGASCVTVPVKPTIKFSEKENIKRTIERDRLWEAQTPQVFRKEIITKAFKNMKNAGHVTDDSMLVEKIGKTVGMVRGSYRNIKITTEEDLILAEHILKARGK